MHLHTQKVISHKIDKFPSLNTFQHEVNLWHVLIILKPHFLKSIIALSSTITRERLKSVGQTECSNENKSLISPFVLPHLLLSLVPFITFTPFPFSSSPFFTLISPWMSSLQLTPSIFLISSFLPPPISYLPSPSSSSFLFLASLHSSLVSSVLPLSFHPHFPQLPYLFLFLLAQFILLS